MVFPLFIFFLFSAFIAWNMKMPNRPYGALTSVSMFCTVMYPNNTGVIYFIKNFCTNYLLISYPIRVLKYLEVFIMIKEVTDITFSRELNSEESIVVVDFGLLGVALAEWYHLSWNNYLEN